MKREQMSEVRTPYSRHAVVVSGVCSFRLAGVILYKLVLTGKHTVIFDESPRKLDLDGKHVVNSATFVLFE